MSWLFSQALVEAYGEARFSDGKQCVLLNGNPTPQAFLHSDKMTEFSRLSRFGMTFAPLTENLGAELLTWFLEASRAKTYRLLAKGLGLTGKEADFGKKWRGLFLKFNRATSWWRTHQCLFQEDLPRCSLTLPQWGLMLDGALLEQVTLERRTNASGCGLLDSTPTKVMPVETDLTQDRIRILPSGRPRKLSKNGTDGSMNWAQLMLHKGLIPTPELCEYYMGWPIGATALQPLETAKFREWWQRHGAA
jgi:hypothetical protein